MLIRSQNKAVLLNFGNLAAIYIVKDGADFIISSLEGENKCTLGKYSTKAKALKVLDMIQEAYTNEKVVEMVACNFRDVPSEVKGISDAIIKKMLLNSAVFQVPEDSEVEV